MFVACLAPLQISANFCTCSGSIYCASKHHISSGYNKPFLLHSVCGVSFVFLFDLCDLEVDVDCCSLIPIDDFSSSSSDSESKSVLSYQGIMFSFSASVTIAAVKGTYISHAFNL